MCMTGKDDMERHQTYADIFNIPVEILDFAYDIFELVEIRAQVAQMNGLIFEVRTSEGNHQKPHVHVKYGEFCISIAIEDSGILAGNLPNKQQSKAQKWINDNRSLLIGKWRELAININLPIKSNIR